MDRAIKWLVYGGLFSRAVQNGDIGKRSANRYMYCSLIFFLKFWFFYVYAIFFGQDPAKQQENSSFRNMLGSFFFLWNWIILDFLVSLLYLLRQRDFARLFQRILKLSVSSSCGSFSKTQLLLLSFQGLMQLLSVASVCFMEPRMEDLFIHFGQSIADFQNLSCQMLLVAMTNALAEVIQSTEQKTLRFLAEVYAISKKEIPLRGRCQKGEHNVHGITNEETNEVLFDSLKTFKSVEATLKKMMQITGPIVIIYLTRSFINSIVITYLLVLDGDDWPILLNMGCYLLHMVSASYLIASLPHNICEKVRYSCVRRERYTLFR